MQYAALLRSLFRPYVCNALELEQTKDARFCRIYIHRLIAQGYGSVVKKTTQKYSQLLYLGVVI